MALGREGLLELGAGPDSIMPKLFKDCEKNTATEVGFQRQLSSERRLATEHRGSGNARLC